MAVKEASAETETVGDSEESVSGSDQGEESDEETAPESETETAYEQKDESDEETASESGTETAYEQKDESDEKNLLQDRKETYKIGAGDILEIVTWREPDFSKEITVRIDGKISFPLLDEIKAAGLTPLELKQTIQEQLKAYITAPYVTVTVKAPQSQKFYILGEVSKTGEYNLIKNLTVLQAFALAGGFTEWASKKEIILVRHEDGKETIIRINYKNIAKGKDFSQNILIKANDTIIVP